MTFLHFPRQRRLRRRAWTPGLVWALGFVAASCQASLCETGQRQSPIAIVHGTRLQRAPLQFDYRAAPLRMANDGHTARVRFDAGSTLRIGGARYDLQQFHFHTPGGEQIGTEAFPMAAHLLHKSRSGQLLAVVVLFRLGRENPLLARLLPLVPEHADGDHSMAAVQVSADELLPAQRGYYRYSGSLTAWPCTEGVDWIVLKEPLELSPAQLAAWQHRFADNMRGVQPLHGRTVWESP